MSELGEGSRFTSFRRIAAQGICRYLPPILAQRVRNIIYPFSVAVYDSHDFTVRAQTGAKFSGNTRNLISYHFLAHGYYDWRNWAVARALCKDGGTIIEIGANAGSETVAFADIVGSKGKVYAFEPLPENLAALNNNITLNGFENVIVLPFAASDQCGQVFFKRPPLEYTGIGHIVSSPEVSQESIIEVQTVTLDSWLTTKQLTEVKVLFVDVEGAEISVLRGSKSLIATFRPFIVLEADNNHQKRFGSTLEILYSEISSHGYQVFPISRLGLAEYSDVLRKKERYYNWFCCPSEKTAIVQVVHR